MPFLTISFKDNKIYPEGAEVNTTVNEKAPEDRADLIKRILDIITYYNIEDINISKKLIRYTYYPDVKVNESEMTDVLIDWYMEKLKKK